MGLVCCFVERPIDSYEVEYGVVEVKPLIFALFGVEGVA